MVIEGVIRSRTSPIAVYHDGKLTRLLSHDTYKDLLPFIPDKPQFASEAEFQAYMVKQLHAEADAYNSQPGKCYFIAGDTGLVKIGYSVDPKSRLAQIQLCSPMPLRILAIARGGKHREAAYHQQFCDHTQCPDEPLYWDEMTTGMECGQCEKVYNVRIYIQTSWTTMVPEIDRLKGDV